MVSRCRVGCPGGTAAWGRYGEGEWGAGWGAARRGAGGRVGRMGNGCRGGWTDSTKMRLEGALEQPDSHRIHEVATTTYFENKKS